MRYVAGLVPFSYPTSLFLLAAALLVVLLGAHARLELSAAHAWGAIFQCAATGYIAWAVIYSHEMLVTHAEKFERLLEDGDQPAAPRSVGSWTGVEGEIAAIYRGWRPYLLCAALASGIFATAVVVVGNPLPSSPATRYVFYASVALLALSAGFGGSTVFLIWRFMVRYARQPLNVSIFQYPDSSFRFIGRLQLSFAWITTFGFVFAALMVFFYWGWSGATAFWVVLGAGSVIGFFLFPQMGFHRKLKSLKLDALDEVSRTIQRLFESSLGQSNPDAAKELKQYYEVAQLVEKLPVWPFNAKALMSALLPLLVTLLGLLFDRLLG